jgi:hypothetical protein
LLFRRQAGLPGTGTDTSSPTTDPKPPTKTPKSTGKSTSSGTSGAGPKTKGSTKLEKNAGASPPLDDSTSNNPVDPSTPPTTPSAPPSADPSNSPSLTNGGKAPQTDKPKKTPEEKEQERLQKITKQKAKIAELKKTLQKEEAKLKKLEIVSISLQIRILWLPFYFTQSLIHIFSIFFSGWQEGEEWRRRIPGHSQERESR